MKAIARLDLDGLDDCRLEGLNLIEASAGTGKTWTICSLYMRLLLEQQLEVQHILVVTFTKAATAELRERIRARLVSTLRILRAESPEATEPIRRLENALHSMDEASIFTIHGFCQRALADRPFAAGLAFEVDLVEDHQRLILETVQDFWRKFIASDRCTMALAQYLELQSDSPEKYAAWLKICLAKPLAKLEWPDDMDEVPNGDEDAFLRDFHEAKALWLDQHEAIKRLLLAAQNDLNRQTYHDGSLDKAYKAWDQWFAATNQTQTLELGECIELLTSARLEQRKRRNAQAPAHRFFILATTLVNHHRQMIRSLERSRFRLLRHMLEWTIGEVRQRQSRLRQTSFDDMLGALHRALHHPSDSDLAQHLAAQYPAALIDEFQDTDPLQFEIFSSIYKNKTHPVFLVGDPKQAIYSFRHADLYTYFRARQGAERIFHLADNRRSEPALIHGVNGLFGHNQCAFVLSDLRFTPVHVGAKPRLRFEDRGSGYAALQVWTLPFEPGAEPSSETGDNAAPSQVAQRHTTLFNKEDAILRSAGACAAEISRLLAQAREGLVRIGERQLCAGDIAILVRTHKQGSVMKAALNALNIGSVELSQESVFHSIDALELERVLLAIQQPRAAPLFHAALSTELIGLDAPSIQEAFDQTRDFSEYVDRFFHYRDLWFRSGFIVMFRRLLALEGIAERLLSRQDGERRLTNMLHLGELLHEAAQSEQSPQSLSAWFARRRLEDHAQEAAQLRLESDQYLVQILTIHKSKGLEFPMVFCPFLWEGAHAQQRSSETYIYDHPVQGTTIRFTSKAAKSESVQAIKDQLDLDDAAEAIRMIYVALTRAVHRCYLVAGCYFSGPKRTSHAQSTASPLNWLAAGNGLSPKSFLVDQCFKKDPDAVKKILAAWAALADRHHPYIDVRNLPGPIETLPLPVDQPSNALAKVPEAPVIDAAWQMASFSSITQTSWQMLSDRSMAEPSALYFNDPDEVDEQSLRPRYKNETDLDSDGLVSNHLTESTPDASPWPLAPDDILGFPRGPQAGSLLHRVLEAIDFDCPKAWPKCIEAVFEQAPLPEASPLPLSPRVAQRTGLRPGESFMPPSPWQDMILTMLGNVLQVDLGHGLVLSTVSAGRRLNELAFTMSAMNLKFSTLELLLRKEQTEALGITEDPPGLSQAQVQAFVRGFIDLIVEHEGRFYLLDWKSNHLGLQAEDYAPGKLRRTIFEHQYHLQYLIYTLALHRYLRQRQMAYRYEAHFGGVFYLFLRAIRPGWRNADSTPTGVYFRKPGFELIEQLDHLFSGTSSTGSSGLRQ